MVYAGSGRGDESASLAVKDNLVDYLPYTDNLVKILFCLNSQGKLIRMK